ncbi:SET domain-containing protein-lysine N-methyltransferase [Patescibacteria group bacterium]
MKCWISPKVERRGSKISGNGLYAKTDIPADKTIAGKSGDVYDAETHARIKKQLGSVALQIDENLYMGPQREEEVEATMIRMNHSCNPNVHIVGQILFKTSRPILKDEELVFDYAMTEGDPTFRIDCNCGASNCRKTITGDDWKKPELQERYGNYFSPYLLKRIRKSQL